ncbi:MAG: PilZ domain-containing protein [bacterium]
MERRVSRRRKVSLKAERISGKGNHTVFIENISEHGICILTPHSSETKKFSPGAEIDLKFELNSGKTINLFCRVRWFYEKMPPDGLTDSIGLEVVDPPQPYKKFVKALH